jgi:hypothetical protein
LSGLRDDESVYRGGLSPVILPSLEKKADELLAAYGLTLHPSSNTYTRLLRLLIRADLENIQRAGKGVIQRQSDASVHARGGIFGSIRRVGLRCG